MGRVTDTRHIGVPLFLGLCVVSIIIAVTPLWTAAQTPPATEQATSEGGAADTQAATGATVDTSGGATTEQGGAATGDSTDGTPSDNGAGNGNDAPSPTVAPTEPPLTPTEPIVAPTPTMPLDTPTPTPTPALPNTDTLSATSDTAPATLQPGQARQYTFTYTVTTPRTGTTIHAELRLDDGSPATGWLLQAQAGQGAPTGDGPAVDVTESATLTPGGTFPLTIVAQAPKDVTASQTVALFISSTATTESGEFEKGVSGDAPVATLSIAPPPTPTPVAKPRMQLSAIAAATPVFNCSTGTQTQASPLIVGFQCDAFSGVANHTYTLSVSKMTQGWQYNYNSAGWKSPTTFPALLANSNGSNFQKFPISFGQVNTSSPPYGEVTLTIVSVTPDSTEKYEVTLTAGTKKSCDPTVSADSALAFQDSKWTGNAYSPTSGNLTFKVNAATDSWCSGLTSGWTIQVSTEGMTGSGGSIPPEAISYTGQVGSTNGIGPKSGTVALSTTPFTIATGNSSVSNGATWTASFGLQPPTEAPTGSYTGTITITTGSGS